MVNLPGKGLVRTWRVSRAVPRLQQGVEARVSPPGEQLHSVQNLIRWEQKLVAEEEQTAQEPVLGTALAEVGVEVGVELPPELELEQLPQGVVARVAAVAVVVREGVAVKVPVAVLEAQEQELALEQGREPEVERGREPEGELEPAVFEREQPQRVVPEGEMVGANLVPSLSEGRKLHGFPHRQYL